MNVGGSSILSPKTSRIFRTQKFRPWSKSTYVSRPQSCSRMASRVNNLLAANENSMWSFKHSQRPNSNSSYLAFVVLTCAYQMTRSGMRKEEFSLALRSSLHCDPQFQTFKLFLSHAFQSDRCDHIQGGNVFHFVARRCLATKLLYFWVTAHLQKHFIRIGYRQSLCDQSVLNKNAMIRRCRQCCWRVLLGAVVMFWVFHGTMLTRFLNEVISLAGTPRSCSTPQADRLAECALSPLPETVGNRPYNQLMELAW